MAPIKQKAPCPSSSSSSVILTPPSGSESSSHDGPSSVSHVVPTAPTASERPLITMGVESAKCIRRLLQEQIDELVNEGKGKQPSRDPTDIEIALESLNRQIRVQEQLEADLAFATSLEKTLQEDEDILARFQREEAMARADRQLALSLAGMGGAPVPTVPAAPTAGRIPPTTPGSAGPSATASQTKTQPTSLKASEETKHKRPAQDPVAAESSNAAQKRRLSSTCAESSQTAERRQKSVAPQSTCGACQDSAVSTSMIQAPCLHHYCKPCLVHLVELALAGKTPFPPRCCTQTIPLSLLRSHIGADLTLRHEEKTIEREDPHPSFCSNNACARYILPAWKKGNTATCRTCGRQTCTLCGAEHHEGACQPEDDKVLKFAAEKQWQRCKCGYVVELNLGCHHITCPCGFHFCYVCGKKWKTCDCPYWNEARLYNPGAQAAAQLAAAARPLARSAAPARAPVAARPAAPARPAAGEQAMAIQPRRACEHDERWDRVEGQHECEWCHMMMRLFILQCPDCRLRACVRCKIARCD